MKLRTQLVLAFLVLAILPLSGIVLYGLISSERAFRLAVEEEARQIAGEIETNIADARQELRDRWSLFESAPSFGAEAFEADAGAFQADAREWEAQWGSDPASVEKAIESALVGIGDVVRSIEIVPTIFGAPESAEPEEEPEGGEPAEAAAAPDPGALPTPGPAAPMPSLELRADVAPGAPEASLEPFEVKLQHQKLAEASARLAERLADLHAASDRRERAVEVRRERIERRQEARDEARESREEARQEAAAEAELERIRQRDLRLKKVLGEDFSTVIAGGLGRLDADIDIHRFFRQVLARSQREHGEVPFALGPEGEIFVISDEDRERLVEITSSLPGGLGQLSEEVCETCELDGWIMATREDPETEMVFGIARPIRESLAEMKRASGRNFLLGLGMISVALVGVLPLSGRLTRGLQRLTAEADRIAGGDLGARAHVSGRDELGQLAGAFNRMASELAENQERLLDQERREREREVERRLLESENARRGEELEAARRFQLSLLPSRLPEHPAFDIAVLVKTATEVGGDYYDFLNDTDPGAAGDDRPLTVAIGDAAGHGARAGTMVTVIKALFASRAGALPPDEFLVEANRSIRSMGLERMTMALQIARLSAGRLEVASAGMPQALVFRSGDEGSRVEEVEVVGLPLGGLDDTDYGVASVDLGAGDSVLFMSDGFAELTDDAGDPTGYAAVRDLFEARGHGSADEVIGALSETLREITGGGAPTDDVTFVVVRRVR